MTSTDSEQPENAAPPREMGEQPLAGLMREHGLSNHDLVAAAARPLTHKLISRAAKGRRLTAHSKNLVLEAYIRATGQSATLTDLFNY